MVDKVRAAIKQRKYEKDGYMLVTMCDHWPTVKVGCGVCEKECELFHSHDREKQAVNCFDPEKDLF